MAVELPSLPAAAAGEVEALPMGTARLRRKWEEAGGEAKKRVFFFILGLEREKVFDVLISLFSFLFFKITTKYKAHRRGPVGEDLEVLDLGAC